MFDLPDSRGIPRCRNGNQIHLMEFSPREEQASSTSSRSHITIAGPVLCAENPSPAHRACVGPQGG
eukprot:6535492-Pyramimonas_sp.AAC.1